MGPRGKWKKSREEKQPPKRTHFRSILCSPAPHSAHGCLGVVWGLNSPYDCVCVLHLTIDRFVCLANDEIFAPPSAAVCVCFHLYNPIRQRPRHPAAIRRPACRIYATPRTRAEGFCVRDARFFTKTKIQPELEYRGGRWREKTGTKRGKNKRKSLSKRTKGFLVNSRVLNGFRL